MPRRPRFEIAGVPQHVVQRGNNRAPVFHDDADRRHYLALSLRLSRKRLVEIHAYVLMGNHVHWLLTTQAPGSCSGFMHDLGSMYVSYFNERHKRSGGLWEGRFKNCVVDNQSYLWNCFRYIELNPVRAGMTTRPDDFPWSSHASNALGQSDPLISPRPEYLALGTSRELRCAAYRKFVALTCDQDELAFARLRRGGILGTNEFETRVASSLGQAWPPPSRGRPAKHPL
jgi:putative transposase